MKGKARKTNARITVPAQIVADVLLGWPVPATLTDGPITAYDLANSFLLHQRVAAAKGDEKATFWSVDCLFRLCDEAPETGLLVVEYAIELATTIQELGMVAAGPLEDLISWHPERVIGRVEEMARQSGRFRCALTGVWPQGREDTEYWNRVLRARSGTLHIQQITALPED